VSLQPFQHPVCAPDGTTFDLTNILPWLKKHGTNPVTGEKLESKDLLKLNYLKNDEGEYLDPVTHKVFTDNTHIVAIRTSGNVFAWDTVERLNIKAKNWRDLVSDDEFTRKDIITLQDPQDLTGRSLANFKYIKDGTSTLTPEQEAERADPLSKINIKAAGSAAKILAAKEAVAKARAASGDDPNANPARALEKSKSLANSSQSKSSAFSKSAVPYNAAIYTTGKAAASFTSTGMDVHTLADRALISDEDYMLKPRRIKIKGYARIQTNYGDITVELQTEFAPRTVYNFVKLSQKGYYNGIRFHRNIKNFMIQGGDPTGSGKGGVSYWGKNFNDEFENPLVHNARGILSMANKGKNTNSSQFFITYRAVKHLDRKHTIFGNIVGGMEVLDTLEQLPVGEGDRPVDPIIIREIVVFVDPFAEFMAKRKENEEQEGHKAEIARQGGTEDDRTTWTGKRLRADGSRQTSSADVGVGKYLKASGDTKPTEEGANAVEEWEQAYEAPAKKKVKGGFGNFDAW
jgi:peptidyl-prolyl cis-trans isomerase-like protein 2